jgi:NADH:ubiquinone oxidoreductase subunit 6 (subunit J)
VKDFVGIGLFPRVEDPFPETIGLGAIFSTAGAGGVLLLVLASMLNRPEEERDAWTRRGVIFGFVAGLLFYVTALVNQVL